MFQIETKALETAIMSARQLKAASVVLYAGKHGVLFATRSDAGTFMSLLATERQKEAAVVVNIEDIVKATYQAKAVELEINVDHIMIKSKKMRSVIRLAAEPAKPGDILELWDARSNGNSAPTLARMLAENKSLFSIKDHVGGKSVPVHIRWNKEGAAAGMSDNYHGVSIKTDKAPLDKKSGKELFVYSSWLPLLIDYLAPPEPKKGEEAKKPERALLHITDTNISVSTKTSLLVLESIVPGADVITLDHVNDIASTKSKHRIKLSMADCNGALRRALSVLPIEASVKFQVSDKKPERLRIEGVHDSGSRIIEEVKTSRSDKSFSFSSTLYNLLDITAAAVTACDLAMVGRAVIFSYSYGAKSDTVYKVDLFSVVTSS